MQEIDAAFNAWMEKFKTNFNDAFYRRVRFWFLLQLHYLCPGAGPIAGLQGRLEGIDMKRISEKQIRDEASRGKNEPMAKTPKVRREQNGEVEPLRSTARKQPGTDQARK
jgi:hypothetical protein